MSSKNKLNHRPEHDNFKQFEFKNCEVCGKPKSAIWRFWNNRYECKECSLQSFRRWYKAMFGGAMILLIIGLLNWL